MWESDVMVQTGGIGVAVTETGYERKVMAD